MSGWFARAVLAGLGLLVLATVASYLLAPVMSEAELRERAAKASVSWQNYSEDIKAIEARAAAEWKGELREIRRADGSYTLVFALEGPWARRDFGLPILVRDAVGYVRRAEFSGNREGAATYRLSMPPGAESLSQPWLEVQYPRGRRRIPLDEEGNWRGD